MIIVNSKSQKTSNLVSSNRFWIFLAFTLVLFNVGGQDKISINHLISVYRSAEDINGAEALIKIKKSELEVVENKVSAGRTSDFIWIHFEGDSLANWDLMELANSAIDKFEVYLIEDNSVSSILTGGDHFHFSKRPIDYRNFIWEIDLDTHKEYLIKIDKRNSTVSYPLRLWSRNGWESRQKLEFVYNGIYFGIIFLAGLSALIIAITFHSKVIFWYALYAILIAVFTSAYSGYLFQFVYPEIPKLNDFVRPIVSTINIICSAFFLINLIHLQRKLPWIKKATLAISFLLITLLILAVLNQEWARLNSSWLLNVVPILFLIESIILWWGAYLSYQDQKLVVKLFFINSVFVFGGSFAFSLSEYGMIDWSSMLIDPMALGLGIEIIIFGWFLLTNMKKTLVPKNEDDKKGNPKEFITPSGTVLNVSDITFLKSEGHYIEIHQSNMEPLIERLSLKEAIKVFSESNSLKTHRSYLVNPNSIRVKYADRIVLNNGSEIPLSRSFKERTEEALKKI